MSSTLGVIRPMYIIGVPVSPLSLPSSADALECRARVSVLTSTSLLGCVIASGLSISATSRGSANLLAISATGRPVSSASLATAVAFLYPSSGSSAVTMPMELSTSSLHRSGFAVMPSMHLVRSVFSPRSIRFMLFNRLYMMIGSKTLSWSCAASDADAMVWSVPIT